MTRLMEKLERMKDALGQDHVYDVISSIFEAGQVRLDTLIRDAITNRRTMDEILAELEFIEDPAAVAAVRESMSDALATAHIDMGSILHEERDSKERRLTPEFVERFFVDGLRYLDGRVDRGSDRDWKLDHVPVLTSARKCVRRTRANSGRVAASSPSTRSDCAATQQPSSQRRAIPSSTPSSNAFSIEGGPSWRRAPSSLTRRRVGPTWFGSSKPGS